MYEYSLSTLDVNSIALNGTMKFQTSTIPIPPVVEILNLTPGTNGSAQITGDLVSKDSNNPSVQIYYGNEDGGFDISNWDSWVDVSSGNPLGLGEFNQTISGLIPGETYFFKAFASSSDGEDWSSGDPLVIDDLLSFWRFDEQNGSIANDSIYPLNPASFQGDGSNLERLDGLYNKGLSFDGR